jgi:hypothetical protein
VSEAGLQLLNYPPKTEGNMFEPQRNESLLSEEKRVVKDEEGVPNFFNDRKYKKTN